MSEHETAKTIINMSNDVLKGSKLLFPLPDVLVTSFGILGSIVNGIITLTKPQAPGLGDQLKEISGKLTEISRKMDSSVATLASLIVDNNFKTDITVKIGKLERLMCEVLELPTPMRMKEFLDECRRNSPYSLILEIKGRLEHDSTNPLTKAMQADELKSTTTLNAWRDTIESHTSRLMIVQSYYAGHEMFEKFGRPLANADPESAGAGLVWLTALASLGDSLNTTNKAVDEIKAQVMNIHFDYDTKYWPETVLKVVENTVDNNKSGTNAYKAHLIQQKLEQIHTWDQFYIVVYNNVQGYGRHVFFWNDNQGIAVKREGNCNVCLYRSIHKHKMPDRLMQNFNGAVEAYRDNYVNCDKHDGMKESAKNIYNRMKTSEAGFVAIIEDEANVAITQSMNRLTNQLPRDNNTPWWGPGWWITANCSQTTVYPCTQVKKYLKKVKLIVGYK